MQQQEATSVCYVFIKIDHENFENKHWLKILHVETSVISDETCIGLIGIFVAQNFTQAYKINDC